MMEKNHICKKCGGIAGWDSYFQSWICTRCGNNEPKFITNYDRLISKSPEELAEWIVEVECEAYRLDGTYGSNYWIKWLKQEAKE